MVEFSRGRVRANGIEFDREVNLAPGSCDAVPHPGAVGRTPC